MDVQYRAQVIVLKKALAEKNEVIKSLQSSQLHTFLKDLQISLDLADTPDHRIGRILLQLLNAFQKDFNLEPTAIQGEGFSAKILHDFSRGFRLVQAHIYHTEIPVYELLAKLLKVLQAARNLVIAGLDSAALQRYMILLANLIIDIQRSTNSSKVKAISSFALKDRETLKQSNNPYPLINALIKPTCSLRKSSIKEVHTQTDQDEPLESLVNQPVEEQQQSVAAIRLHQFSTTIQELRSKLSRVERL